MKPPHIQFGGKGFKIWRRRADLNNLSLTKKIMRDIAFTRHDISLDDMISWSSYEGTTKRFCEQPSPGCLKLPRLSYAKFLTVFSELVLHFIGRNLSSFHQPLAIDPQSHSPPSTPSRQSQPAVLPAALSPINSPERENADRDPETTMESEESYHVSQMFVSPEIQLNHGVNPEGNPEVTPEVNPDVNSEVMLRPFLANEDYNNIAGIRISQNK